MKSTPLMQSNILSTSTPITNPSSSIQSFHFQIEFNNLVEDDIKETEKKPCDWVWPVSRCSFQRAGQFFHSALKGKVLNKGLNRGAGH